MKFRIDGKKAWLTWQDGVVDGSPEVLMQLEISDRHLADQRIGIEFMEVDNPAAQKRFCQPFRVFHLCVDTCYGLSPIFDFGSPKYDMSEVIAAQPKRPDGAV